MNKGGEISGWLLKRKLENSAKYQTNMVKLDTGNSIVHEFCKFLLGWMDKKAKIPFVQEAKFKNHKGIADHLRMTGTYIEVLHSETRKEAEEKTAKYPVWGDHLTSEQVRKLFASDRLRDWLELLEFVVGKS